jgi:hypothetical protein
MHFTEKHFVERLAGRSRLLRAVFLIGFRSTVYAYTLLSQKFYFQSVLHRKTKCILKKQSVTYILLLLGTPVVRNLGCGPFNCYTGFLSMKSSTHFAFALTFEAPSLAKKYFLRSVFRRRAYIPTFPVRVRFEPTKIAKESCTLAF